MSNWWKFSFLRVITRPNSKSSLCFLRFETPFVGLILDWMIRKGQRMKTLTDSEEVCYHNAGPERAWVTLRFYEGLAFKGSRCHFVESKIWLHKMSCRASSRHIRTTVQFRGIFHYILLLKLLLKHLYNHMHFITNGFKRWTNSIDPRKRVPLIYKGPIS